MRIKVQDIRNGDYVVGFGEVVKVVLLHKLEARTGKTKTSYRTKVKTPALRLARIIASEVEDCYQQVLRGVTLVGVHGQRTYKVDAVVETLHSKVA
jgi:hypothetical protein